MKLSLAMIVKGTADEAVLLDRCLQSVSDHVDEIITVITHAQDEKADPAVRAVAAKYGAKIFDFEWINDFSAARNYSFSKATGDWTLWLDADDTVQNPENLKPLCESVTNPNIAALNLEYYYDHDSKGNVTVQHWRERLIRNNGAMAWKGRLHEVMIKLRECNELKADQVKIVHNTTSERKAESDKRNLMILQDQFEEEKSSPDPRTIYNLAVCYYDMGMFQDAIGLFDIYLTYSGWKEERSLAQVYLGKIKAKLEKSSEAINHYLQAIKEFPDNPTPYVWIGSLYIEQQQWKDSYTWLEMALQKGDPTEKSTLVFNALEYTYLPLVYLAQACMYLGKIDQGLKAIKMAQKYRDDEGLQELADALQHLKGNQLVTQAIADLAKFLDTRKEGAKVPKLLEAVPDELKDNPVVIGLKRAYTDPVVWPSKSIVIYCGDSTLGEWGPWSLKDGIGGSEEAVVRLSRRLTEQGYAVTIYASPGAQSGVYDGVTWLNHWELDSRDTFDIFVAWRSPWMFEREWKARRAYLWLHDVMTVEEFTPERLKNLDKVIVLSQYHRSLFPDIPEDKITISANGIDAEEFDQVLPRDPHKIIYQSAHERGLNNLLEIWPKIKAKVPDAKLRIMYGWHSFIAINKDNPERMDWMEKMNAKIAALDGVENLGKVSHEEVVEEILTAGVWAYPSLFPEISCITAMKVQAGGAIPVTSTYGALAETVRFGLRLPFEEWDKEVAKQYSDMLIEMLDPKKQEKIRPKMMKQARKDFSWTEVAKQWIGEFES